MGFDVGCQTIINVVGLDFVLVFVGNQMRGRQQFQSFMQAVEFLLVGSLINLHEFWNKRGELLGIDGFVVYLTEV